MKTLIFFILFFSLNCYAQGDFDFRNNRWDDTKEDVIKTEKEQPPYDTGDRIGYIRKIANLQTFVYYQFLNNKLAKGYYIFTEEHVNKNSFITDYKSVNTLLKEKYGDPQIDNENWSNDLYKKQPAQYGFAVSVGHLHLFTNWQETETRIDHLIHGDNFKITHLLTYTAKKYSDQLMIKEKKQSSEGL